MEMRIILLKFDHGENALRVSSPANLVDVGMTRQNPGTTGGTGGTTDRETAG